MKKIYLQPDMVTIRVEATAILASSSITEVAIGEDYDETMVIEARKADSFWDDENDSFWDDENED